jgi:hypothetical protein
VNTRKNAAAAMIAKPCMRLVTRATKIPMKISTAMAAPAPFLWPNAPRQLPARSVSITSVG